MISIKRLGSNCFPVPNKNNNSNSFDFNGYEYVDLGLPSGTLWATMNVGANSPTDYGLYFAWGETTGYTASQVGTGEGQKAFSWNDYKYGTSSNNLTKYNTTDRLTVLDLEDDAVRANWGGDWYMPTKEQCEELLNTEYITNEWVENYNGSGINGCLFTSLSNGNTMFIPAAAGCTDGEVSDSGDNYGIIWTSVLNSKARNNAWSPGFGSDGVGIGHNGRYKGFSVRGVVGQMDEIPPTQEAVIPS